MSGQYAIDSIGMNPYFMGAYNFPNANYMTTQQTTPTKAVSDTTTTETAPAVTPKKEEEKKDNSTAKLIVGTALVLVAAYLCKKAHGIGEGATAMEKIKDGFSQWGKKLTGKAKDLKDKVVNPEKFSITQVGDQTVCTIPGKKNVIKGATTDIAAQAEKLGVSTDIAELASKESNILSYTIKDAGNTITVRGGNIVGFKNSAGEAIDIKKLTAPMTESDIAYSKTIKELMEKVGRRDTTVLSQLENVYYTQTANGTTRRFVANAADPKKNGLRGVITNRFEVGSDTVKQYRQHNEPVSKALDALKEGKTDGLKIAEAQCDVAGIGKFKIENGEIAGITVGDTYYKKGSERFDALLFDHKEAFENVLKNKEQYTDIIYHMA